jgi:hypothetical protein
MDRSKALAIVSSLANGVHPVTGEAFPPDSPYQAPDVIRALFIAAQALEVAAVAPAAVEAEARPSAPPRTGRLPNVGKPWTAEEDERLVAEFEQGRSPRELAREFGRTLAGIEARLEKLGKLAPEQRVTSNRYGARAGGQVAGTS